jgi:hypothetical protein
MFYHIFSLTLGTFAPITSLAAARGGCWAKAHSWDDCGGLSALPPPPCARAYGGGALHGVTMGSLVAGNKESDGWISRLEDVSEIVARGGSLPVLPRAGNNNICGRCFPI